MAFIFEDKADVDKILNHSWTFRDLQVIVRKWLPDKSLSEVNLNTTSFWIQAFGIPVCFINLESATFIGNSIGLFQKADITSTSHKWKKFLRIKVDINILFPLKSSVMLHCHGRSDVPVEIRYERLTDFCFKCGLLGHKIQNCLEAFSDMVMDSSTHLFGPWLKAENTLVPNPFFQTCTTPKTHNPQSNHPNISNQNNTRKPLSINHKYNGSAQIQKSDFSNQDWISPSFSEIEPSDDAQVTADSSLAGKEPNPFNNPKSQETHVPRINLVMN